MKKIFTLALVIWNEVSVFFNKFKISCVLKFQIYDLSSFLKINAESLHLNISFNFKLF